MDNDNNFVGGYAVPVDPMDDLQRWVYWHPQILTNGLTEKPRSPSLAPGL